MKKVMTYNHTTSQSTLPHHPRAGCGGRARPSVKPVVRDVVGRAHFPSGTESEQRGSSPLPSQVTVEPFGASHTGANKMVREVHQLAWRQVGHDVAAVDAGVRPAAGRGKGAAMRGGKRVAHARLTHRVVERWLPGAVVVGGGGDVATRTDEQLRRGQRGDSSTKRVAGDCNGEGGLAQLSARQRGDEARTKPLPRPVKAGVHLRTCKLGAWLKGSLPRLEVNQPVTHDVVDGATNGHNGQPERAARADERKQRH